ncbi:hypothetical protein QWZ06_09335 [Chryseobacterium tructae]|uniref:tetratricopeptide repeat protein n=1 Tax=Chryseobacterium tructae TaxID=1037380 RepID=UPI0025B31C0F|nr:hypothetical protein [Chryseobacterium tructae]MDN3692461.1 hypothetical protein [Chryseobacterium tructae]
MSNYKMAHHYADISIAISEKIDLKDYLSAKHIYRYRAFIYFYKSWIFLEENKPDSAYSFIQKAYDQAIFEKYKFLAPFYETYGDYYFKVHNFKKAVSFYLKCLENKHKFRQNAANVNAKISKTYKLLGDREKEIYYLQKAESMRTLDSKSDSKIVQEELNRTLVKKQTEENKLMKNNTLFIVFIILFFTVFLVTIIVHERRIKNKKSEIISAQKIIIHKKESEIKEREQKIGELQKKVTDALPELIDLVKNNSPYFFGRFQEVYPEFCLKMLEINPMLKSSELTFCAYIYLGISTKEIANIPLNQVKQLKIIDIILGKG